METAATWRASAPALSRQVGPVVTFMHVVCGASAITLTLAPIPSMLAGMMGLACGQCWWHCCNLEHMQAPREAPAYHLWQQRLRLILLRTRICKITVRTHSVETAATRRASALALLLKVGPVVAFLHVVRGASPDYSNAVAQKSAQVPLL